MAWRAMYWEGAGTHVKISNFENYDLFHAQSPDTGRCVHTRSWRANRDVDVKRWFLG